MTDHDTIFALSSGAGPAGVSVIRVSGPNAAGVAALLERPLPSPRRVVLRTIFGVASHDRIDRALVLSFPAPNSFTGENIVEMQCHGGRAVAERMLSELSRLEGFRLAEPGEFTRRAVLNGKLDLVQAEALADLINAETDVQRRQALRQYEGGLGTIYEAWRARLIKASAWLEASIDFADEEIPESAVDSSLTELALIRDEISTHLADGRRGEILRDGFHIAVIGPPNAGKSSLVNALARRDVAIVTDIPGTTRDVLEVRLDIHGYPVILSDTAGLRETTDFIEAEGVRRARARAEAADLRLLVLDGAGAPPREAGSPEAELVVFNKADLVRTRGEGLWLSTKTGEGLHELIERIGSLAARRIEGEAPALTRARHREALADALAGLNSALSQAHTEFELTAEDCRRALRSLGRITGRVDLDELLDVVFRDFCIGK